MSEERKRGHRGGEETFSLWHLADMAECRVLLTVNTRHHQVCLCEFGLQLGRRGCDVESWVVDSP